MVEHGAERKTKTKIIPAKKFNAQRTCKCASKQNVSCFQKIGIERQTQIFDQYYKHMLWTQKTMFIRGSVKRQLVKRKKSYSHPIIPLKDRNFNYIYSLTDESGAQHVVCRDFFLGCLQIKSARVSLALKSENVNASAFDRRGNGPPANKTKEVDKENVRQFINSIPKYESHYGRSSSEKKYLLHLLNLTSLYKEIKMLRDY